MFNVNYFFYLVFLHLIIATPQLNLYYTDRVSESKSESDNVLHHTCLRVAFHVEQLVIDREIITYCLNEFSSKFEVDKSDSSSQFTFAELSKQNISSQQLYLWSAPIDLIERYQFYLNQLSTVNDESLAKQVFYNCTLPRFGPVCQYEFYYYDSRHSSLAEMINGFYKKYQYILTTFTCYTHLQCNRGASPACLDWSEICDGKVDCLDGGYDEEYCWELEINQCKENEYRCPNGQCISQSFYKDHSLITLCIDATDVHTFLVGQLASCHKFQESSILCDDIRCPYTHWPSSCMKDRKDLLMKAMYSSKDNSMSEKCWLALQCIFNVLDSEYLSCNEVCERNAYTDIVKNSCPDMFYFPNVPVLFNDVYFVFTKNDAHHLASDPTKGLYICYNTSHYDDYFVNALKMSFNNMTCVHSERFLSPFNYTSISPLEIHKENVLVLSKVLKKYHLSFTYTPAICNRSTMYQCLNSSKCISVYRLVNTIYDCPHMDDENITLISHTDRIEQIKQNYFKCQRSNKYIPQALVRNLVCDCDDQFMEVEWCEDEDLDVNYFQRNILFQHICDGFIDLLPIMIAEQNETDETECQQWECNNIYTRCNNVWNCPNGADESGCISFLTLNCSSEYHPCVSPQTNQLMCLPIEKANDGHVDCLGATDEPTRCGKDIRTDNIPSLYNFYCMNHSSRSCIDVTYLCDGVTQCDHGDDEQFCETNRTLLFGLSACPLSPLRIASDVEKFLCNYKVPVRYWKSIYFQLDGMSNLVENRAANTAKTVFSRASLIKISAQHQPRCHRGVDLRVWLNNTKNLTTSTCLCPPSFYGDQCQYQNQRITLTIKFQASSDSWRTLFAIVISLIDDSDQRIIHSYEQITYLWLKNCNIKFNLYLLYSTRPKDPTKYYSIHIDIYEKLKLTYRGSVLLPITFPFLPVHRLVFSVDIPRTDDKTQSCSNDPCVHGKCIRYSNNPENNSFCQCERGWFGRYCTLQHTCTCASDLSCIGVSSHNRSVCVCPLNQFGLRCLLTDTICRNDNNSTCQNGGQCISNIDYIMLNREFICICRKGFSGDECEIADNKLIISIEKSIIFSQSMFIHFIQVVSDGAPVRATTFQTIPLRQDSIIIYWSQPFNLVFIELENKNYYLADIQKIYNRSTTINKMIHPKDHCPPISELFNETFVQWPLLRQIKYYRLLCQQQSLNLSCFYDDVHLCLCYNFGDKRLANCFIFEHNMTLDCKGRSECQKDARCLQDHPDCPTKSMCLCPRCSYGRRCQFSTRGFGLALDGILGYHISPGLSLTQQRPIVQFSLALTIIFMIAGFINGVLSLITFTNKIVCQVGCGLYLLGSSITSLCIMILFGLKFWIFLLAQMSIISNNSFLQVQCHSIDFLLRVCLNMEQWLSACVAAERAITTIKGPSFIKKKSKQAAKVVIVILLIVIVGTCIHDPICRQLIDEKDDDDDDDDDLKRIWCIVTYSSSLEVYNYIIHCFHFFCPFLINLISSITLILKISDQQSNLHKQRPYKEILREQFRQHKHLLTAPIVLVLLAVPRLVIAFVSKCMDSANDAWLYLVGYFISFIPPMLTLIIFILPSEFYKKELRTTLQQYRTNIQRCLHLTS